MKKSVAFKTLNTNQFSLNVYSVLSIFAQEVFVFNIWFLRICLNVKERSKRFTLVFIPIVDSYSFTTFFKRNCVVIDRFNHATKIMNLLVEASARKLIVIILKWAQNRVGSAKLVMVETSKKKFFVRFVGYK